MGVPLWDLPFYLMDSLNDVYRGAECGEHGKKYYFSPCSLPAPLDAKGNLTVVALFGGLKRHNRGLSNRETILFKIY
ncbi:hypothetical protein ACFL1Z_00520 [Thermodesulfobacteriota bacterium]